VHIPPLAGFVVAVTADRRADEQAELLLRRGAEVLHTPTIRTLPLVDDDALRDTISELVARPPDVTVLLTGIGTRGLIGAAEGIGLGEQLLGALRRSSTVARGPKATGAALAAGLEVVWRAPGERASEIAEHLSAVAAGGARIAVQRDGDERPLLADALSAAGADVVDVPVYRWVLPEDDAPARRLLSALRERSVDAVTFTSSPAVRNLRTVAERTGHEVDLVDAFRDDVIAACVGPVCAETAAGIGIANSVTPARARLGSMVLALTRAFDDRRIGARIAGIEVLVQGRVVVVGGAAERLTDRERAVLQILVEARGAVVTKRELLRGAWRHEDVDEHAVEMAVARLRRRLGRAGAAIETVPRRGYRLRPSANAAH